MIILRHSEKMRGKEVKKKKLLLLIDTEEATTYATTPLPCLKSANKQQLSWTMLTETTIMNRGIIIRLQTNKRKQPLDAFRQFLLPIETKIFFCFVTWLMEFYLFNCIQQSGLILKMEEEKKKTPDIFSRHFYNWVYIVCALIFFAW